MLRVRSMALLNSRHSNDNVHAPPDGCSRSWIRCIKPTPIIKRLMENDPEEISLRDLFDTLWSRRLLIIALTLAFGIAAAVVSLLLPEKYEASIVLLPVDEESGGKLGGAGAAGTEGGAPAKIIDDEHEGAAGVGREDVAPRARAGRAGAPEQIRDEQHGGEREAEFLREGGGRVERGEERGAGERRRLAVAEENVKAGDVEERGEHVDAARDPEDGLGVRGVEGEEERTGEAGEEGATG
eukprot:gene60259-82443_t